jgi:hypothetical protein
MDARTIQIVTAVATALVSLLNGALGWHLNAADVLGVVLSGVGLVLALAHVEAAHGTLAQEWAAIKPKLEAFLEAAAKAMSDAPTASQQQNQQQASTQR